MKSIVTAIHDDGTKWGWPGKAVCRYRGEDGSWAWIPQPRPRLAVGDIFDEDGGWEWLSDDEREVKLTALERKSAAERKADLIQQAHKLDKLDKLSTQHARKKKTPSARLESEIAESLDMFRRRRKKP